MKRFLLTVAVACVATAMFAQLRSVADKRSEQLMVPQATMPIEVATQPALTADTNADNQRRSAATGLYYGKPYEMMYENYFSETGGGYYNSEYRVPYFNDFTYINMSVNPTTTTWWYYFIYNNNQANNLGSGDSNGNYVQSLDPGYMSTALRLYDSNGSDFYNMGYYDNNGYPGTYDHYIYGSDELAWLAYTDNKGAYGFNSSQTSNGYIMGSTTLNGVTVSYQDADGSTGTLTGNFPISYVYQVFPAPPAPMYVENVWMRTLNDGETYKPFTDDASLTMEIYNSETGELKQTLTATKDGIIDWGSSFSVQYTPSGYYSQGCISFSNMVQDQMLGLMMAEPFVIDYPMIVYVLGFDAEGVDVGLSLYEKQDCDIDEALEIGRMVPYDPETGHNITSAFGYSDDIINIMFNGLMDNAYVPATIDWVDSNYNLVAEVNDYNFIRIADDGKSCTTEIDNDDYYVIGKGLYLQTACEWYDEDDSSYEYYYFPDLPDWITGVSLTEYQETQYFLNEYIASFTATAISSGEGRSAVVHLNGRGYVNDTPVYLMQGNITKEQAVAAGISTITNNTEKKTAPSGTYNLAGQRVSESAKGLLIRDGKKVLVK